MLQYCLNYNLKDRAPVLLVLLILNSICFAQKIYKFDHLSLEQGLSQTGIQSIIQDDKGFIWFGTQDGLNRYDGYTFSVYKNDPSNPRSISDNFIYSMYKDRQGTLWFGTYVGGLNKYDRGKDQFTSFQNNPDDPNSLSNNCIFSICEDNDSALWIGTNGGGLNRFNKKTGHFTRFLKQENNPSAISSNIIKALYVDSKGTLWIGTLGGGLNLYDSKSKKFFKYVNDPKNKWSISSNYVRSIYEDKNGNFWIGTKGGGLNKFNRTTGRFVRFTSDKNNPNSIGSDDIWAIADDDNGKLWIATEDGINIFDIRSETFIRLHYDPKDNKSLSLNMVISLFKDKAGAIWIGTNLGGLNIYDSKKEKFLSFRGDGSAGTLSNNNVWTILEDRRGNLFVGTDGGLNQFDKKRNYFTTMFNGEKNHPVISSIQSLFEDDEGKIWIGSYGDGLSIYNPSDGEIINYTHKETDKNSLSDNRVWPIIQDKQGYFWIGTFGGGLNKFDTSTKKFVSFKYDSTDQKSLSNNFITSLYEDKMGNLWVGTDLGGLNLLDRKEHKFKRYTHNQNDSLSISNNIITAIAEDNYGNLWIGTWGGLNKFNREKNSFTHFTEKDGLPNSGIYGILCDNSGNLWLSTNKGLSRFNPKTKKFRNYDTRDGLQSNEFNQGAYFKSKKGFMYFGGINGFSMFNPDSIKDNKFLPPVVITSFKKFNMDFALEKNISEMKEIELAYEDNIFSLGFAALNFRNPEKNKYEYKLEGLNERWIPAGNNRVAAFTNLSPGKYVFRVRASNDDGIWNYKGASITIIVHPPIWRTWWAYTIYVLVIALVLVYIRSYEKKQTKLEEEARLKKEREQAVLRETELRAQAAELSVQAAEAQAKVIEAENKRKSEELEEARKIQLSMLPKKIPQVPGIDIAVYMQTATEVGGDYYDFHVSDDGTLTIAIGDATGHGLKAGTMVTIIKSLFTREANSDNLLSVFKEFTRCLKQMSFHSLSMCLLLAKIKDDKVIYSSAAMPPIFYYNSKTGNSEELMNIGIPLGTISDFPYTQKHMNLNEGDTLLLMSDGFPELLNLNDEMLGYQRALNHFATAAHLNSEEIINCLKESISRWSNGKQPIDDITFVVVKKRSGMTE